MSAEYNSLAAVGEIALEPPKQGVSYTYSRQSEAV